jgi:hypothetical protein
VTIGTPVTFAWGRHISGMKKNAKKPLALDTHTIRSLAGSLAGRVAGGSAGKTYDWRCDPTSTVSGNTNCCGSNVRNGCLV